MTPEAAGARAALSQHRHFGYRETPVADQELYSGLVRLHVLYHASVDVVFGLGMINELRRHGYRVGPGTLYPILHRLERKQYLRSTRQSVQGKIRRVYRITPKGRTELRQATDKVRELYEEMVEGHGEPSPAHPSFHSEAAGAPVKGASRRGGERHSKSVRSSD